MNGQAEKFNFQICITIWQTEVFYQSVEWRVSNVFKWDLPHYFKMILGEETCAGRKLHPQVFCSKISETAVKTHL